MSWDVDCPTLRTGHNFRRKKICWKRQQPGFEIVWIDQSECKFEYNITHSRIVIDQFKPRISNLGSNKAIYAISCSSLRRLSSLALILCFFPVSCAPQEFGLGMVTRQAGQTKGHESGSIAPPLIGLPSVNSFFKRFIHQKWKRLSLFGARWQLRSSVGKVRERSQYSIFLNESYN